LVEECKALEKKAKELEQENVDEAVIVYKQAAECYNKNDKQKNSYGCLGKAAKLLRDKAHINEDPVAALEIFESASEIYNKIDKQTDAEKVTKEAHKKFIDFAKNLRIEAKKSEDPDSAEKLLEKASDYASRGKDDELSKVCWIDSGINLEKKPKK